MMAFTHFYISAYDIISDVIRLFWSIMMPLMTDDVVDIVTSSVGQKFKQTDKAHLLPFI